jgi:pimeloyl-ACP methyl ester carboxylesterase
VHASSGKAQIAYDVVGDAAAGGHDVLLMHAGVNDRRGWLHVVERLSVRHRCVAFDRRGFGETTYEAEDGWSEAGDAVAVMDAAGVEKAVVVACSMGGAAALELTLDHPGRVEGLVLIGSAVRGAPYPVVTDEPDATLERDIDEADEARDLDEVNRLETWMWLDGPSAEGRVQGPARDLFMEMNGHALRQPDPGLRQQREDTWDRLGEIAVPALVLVGTLDVQDVRAVDQMLSERLTDAGLVWLEGVAHVPHLEGHRETINLITDFVDETLPRV